MVTESFPSEGEALKYSFAILLEGEVGFLR